MKTTAILALILAPVAACGSGGGTTDLGLVDLQRPDLTVLAGDADHDGLTDAEELQLASQYLPFLSVSAGDACPTSGLIVRVTPIDPAPLVRLRYVWLFDRRCDGPMIEGDGGPFVVIVDPRQTAPGGLVSLRAIARPDTTCERISTCGRCSGEPSCAALGGGPAVWAGRDLHAIYVDRPLGCTQTSPCAVSCEDAATSAQPPIVDVGEPEAPTVRDLTDGGFIRPENGWTSASLSHHDPWGGAPFGALPPLSELLGAPVVDAPACLSP